MNIAVHILLVRIHGDTRCIALPRIRPVDQTSADGIETSHLVANIHSVVVDALPDIVESVQRIKRYRAHELLVFHP